MISEFPQPPRLPRPLRITEQVWPEGTVPVVSVFNWAYNHVEFIRESIESILVQETTFPVEIIIHDDASTDGTTEIIREYEAKYPQLFRNIIHTENQWSQGKSVMAPLFTSPRGDFVALTHGDDYWTSPHKLQNQVRLLEADPQAVGVFHQVEKRESNNHFLELLPPSTTASLLSFDDIVSLNDRATCSIVYRSKSFRHCDLSWASDLPMGDWPLQLELSAQGHWRFLDQKMGVYRKHIGGVWSGAAGVKVTEGTLKFYDAVVNRYGPSVSKLVNRERKKLVVGLMSNSVERGDWRQARAYLVRYLLTPPRRFTLPAGQKRNLVKLLVSCLRRNDQIASTC